MAQEVTDKNFEEEVLKNDKPVMVDFWAPWCGPCQVMGPIIEEIVQEVGDKMKIVKLNVDENPQTASQYQIMSIPTIKIFKGGEVIKDFMGLQSKEVLVAEINNI